MYRTCAREAHRQFCHYSDYGRYLLFVKDGMPEGGRKYLPLFRSSLFFISGLFFVTKYAMLRPKWVFRRGIVSDGMDSRT